MITRIHWVLILLAVCMGVGNGLGTGRRIGILLGLLPTPTTPVPHLALWMLPIVVGWITLLLVGAVQLHRRRNSAGWTFVASCVLFTLHMAYLLTGEPFRERVLASGSGFVPLVIYFSIFAILIAGSFLTASSANPKSKN